MTNTASLPKSETTTFSGSTPKRGTNTIARRDVMARGSAFETHSTRQRTNIVKAFHPPEVKPSGGGSVTAYKKIPKTTKKNSALNPLSARRIHIERLSIVLDKFFSPLA